MPDQATDASGVLTIPSVRPEDTGTYICTGSDLTSVAQDRATLLVEGIFFKKYVNSLLNFSYNGISQVILCRMFLFFLMKDTIIFQYSGLKWAK